MTAREQAAFEAGIEAARQAACMDPQHRQERRAALNAAWSDLLTA